MKTLRVRRLAKLTDAGGFILMLSVALASASAQDTVNVKGTVFAEIGAVVPGAKILIESETLTRTIQSDDLGRFKIDLPLGEYKLSINLQGFKGFAKDLTLSAGLNEEIVIELQAAPGGSGDWCCYDPELRIAAVHARVFEKMGPRKLN